MSCRDHYYEGFNKTMMAMDQNRNMGKHHLVEITFLERYISQNFKNTSTNIL